MTQAPFIIMPRPTHNHQLVTVVLVVITSFFMALLINTFVFQSYYVDGESMSPTLHTDNRLIISKVERSLAGARSADYVPQRGHIVVINGHVSEATAGRAPELIKRVIGLPGETIIIENGVVTISNQDGTFLPDEKLGLNLEPTFISQSLTLRIPDDSVFVMGDNRSQGGSLDSRIFGPVKTSFIDGRLWAIIMPLDQKRVF